MRTMRRSWTWMVAVAVALAVQPLSAQRSAGERRGPPEGTDRAQLEQRMRARMGQMIREQLGLTEAQSERLDAVVREHETRRRALFREEQGLRRSVSAILEADPVDQAEARRVLLRMADLREEEAQLARAEQVALLEIIEPGQVLVLQALRERIGERIRELRGGRSGDEARDGRGRRGGGGPTPDIGRPDRER